MFVCVRMCKGTPLIGGSVADISPRVLSAPLLYGAETAPDSDRSAPKGHCQMPLGRSLSDAAGKEAEEDAQEEDAQEEEKKCYVWEVSWLWQNQRLRLRTQERV